MWIETVRNNEPVIAHGIDWRQTLAHDKEVLIYVKLYGGKYESHQ